MKKSTKLCMLVGEVAHTVCCIATKFRNAVKNTHCCGNFKQLTAKQLYRKQLLTSSAWSTECHRSSVGVMMMTAH